MTFSIVAVDRENKEVGFAIASCCWNAGLVCRAEAEKGAIASQASGNLEFLELFFHKLNAEKTLEEILAYFKNYDGDIETRQIGLVDFSGNALAFTGAENDCWAGHRTGEGYSCQGNTLTGPRVIDEMASAFERADGRLMERLVSALRAGDDAGGDARGRQSARLCVKKKNGGPAGSDILIDITIADHDEPVKEIGRILKVRAQLVDVYKLFGGLSSASKAEKLPILEKIENMLADKKECRFLDFWEELGDAYYELGEVGKAVEVYRVYLEIGPSLASTLRRNVEKGIFPKELADRLFQ